MLNFRPHFRQATDMTTIRKTQRAPRSCSNCARRRVRCDKNIPCSSCIARNEQDHCSREMVIVNGLVKNGPGSRRGRADDMAHLQTINAQLMERINYLERKLGTNASNASNSSRVGGIPSSRNHQPPSIELQAYVNSNKLTMYNSEWDSVSINTVPDGPVVPAVTFEQSSAIVSFSLDSLSFIHCAIHSPKFYIDFYQPSLKVPEDLSRNQFLECAIWYSLLCCGVYYADEEQLQQWGIVQHPENDYPEKFLRASLECLHRAEYMKYPDIRTVQAFCVLSLCFNQLNSRHLQDCLHLTAIHISQTLGLGELASDNELEREQIDQQLDVEEFRSRAADRELCRRIWWTVVIIDWLRVGHGRSTIEPDSFTTVLPSTVYDQPPISYHISMAKVSKVRRSRRNTIRSLQDCDAQLLDILETLPDDLKYSTYPYFPLDESEITSFERFLIALVINHERLLTNLHLSAVVSTNEWNLTYKPICLRCAQTIIDLCCLNTPERYKKNWIVPADGVPAAVLLLLHDMENPLESTNWSSKVFIEFMPLLEKWSATNEVASRGLNLLKEIKQRNSSESTNHAIDIYHLLKQRRQFPRFVDSRKDSAPELDQLMGFDQEFWDQIIQTFV